MVSSPRSWLDATDEAPPTRTEACTQVQLRHSAGNLWHRSSDDRAWAGAIAHVLVAAGSSERREQLVHRSAGGCVRAIGVVCRRGQGGIGVAVGGEADFDRVSVEGADLLPALSTPPVCTVGVMPSAT